ncbi:hypothetical protein [Streptomyces sp. NPDC002516]
MTWHDATLSHLVGMLDACRTVIARNRKQAPHVRGLELMGVQEWTIPWEMDDGISIVRLTVARDREVQGNSPIAARVLVAAGGTGEYGPTVKLPHYAKQEYTGSFSQESEFVELSERHRKSTKWWADFLLKGVSGDPASLREEPGGAMSFRVLLTES